MRGAAIVAVLALLGGLLVVVAGVSAAPLSQTCAPPLSEEACVDAVEGALKRGLSSIHPLIVASHVEPGPAAATGEYGHKHTVTFDMLGVPRLTSVQMYYDLGGRWGGVIDRSNTEVTLWAIAPLVVAGLFAAVVLAIAWRRRGRVRAARDPGGGATG